MVSPKPFEVLAVAVEQAVLAGGLNKEESQSFHNWCEDGRTDQYAVTLFQKLGRIQQEQGDIDVAFGLYEEALRVERSMHDNQAHPRVAFMLSQLALAYKDEGDAADVVDDFEVVCTAEDNYERARELLQEALSMQRTLSGGGACADEFNTLANLGHVNRTDGKLEDARTCFEECLEILRATKEEAEDEEEESEQASEQIADMLYNLGLVYAKERNYACAQEHFEESLEAMRKYNRGEVGPKFVALLESLGSVYVATGSPHRARQLLGEALDLRQPTSAGQGLDDFDDEFLEDISLLHRREDSAANVRGFLGGVLEALQAARRAPKNFIALVSCRRRRQERPPTRPV